MKKKKKLGTLNLRDEFTFEDLVELMSKNKLIINDRVSFGRDVIYDIYEDIEDE